MVSLILLFIAFWVLFLYYRIKQFMSRPKPKATVIKKRDPYDIKVPRDFEWPESFKKLEKPKIDNDGTDLLKKRKDRLP